MLNHIEIQRLNEKLEDSHPKDVLDEVTKLIPGISISFSGAEDVVLIDLASKLDPTPPVFTLDTGRLHPETYHFIESVRQHYKISVEVLYPDSSALELFIKNKGLFSFYNDGHQECCEIRKVAPLRKKLTTIKGWITGQRRDQSSTRAHISLLELDRTFSTPSHPVIKVNPLANWDSQKVWDHIRLLEIPYNKLHDRGYASVGCEPCTRPIGPNQHEREGRWWWEETTVKECGLHLPNVGRKD